MNIKVTPEQINILKLVGEYSFEAKSADNSFAEYFRLLMNGNWYRLEDDKLVELARPPLSQLSDKYGWYEAQHIRPQFYANEKVMEVLMVRNGRVQKGVFCKSAFAHQDGFFSFGNSNSSEFEQITGVTHWQYIPKLPNP